MLLPWCSDTWTRPAGRRQVRGVPEPFSKKVVQRPKLGLEPNGPQKHDVGAALRFRSPGKSAAGLSDRGDRETEDRGSENERDYRVRRIVGWADSETMGHGQLGVDRKSVV